MISFENVSKIFKPDAFGPPFQALKDLSFQIPKNTITGFLGANGAGKSTSMKIMMDFIRPTKGEVIFDTCLGHSREEIFAKIGFLPERPFFYPNLKGRDFLFYMGSLVNLSKSTISSGITKWAPLFKIDFALDRKIGTYSKGMLQRIGFLATLIHNPDLIILDEPLSGLDPIGRKDLKDIMLEVLKEGKTVFFSSHIISDVEEVCKDVIFLNSGVVEFNGSIDELLKKHQSKKYKIIFKHEKISSEFKSQISLKGHNLYEAIIDYSEKGDFLQRLITHKADIISLETEKKSLEEIFYKVKSASN